MFYFLNFRWIKEKANEVNKEIDHTRRIYNENQDCYKENLCFKNKYLNIKSVTSWVYVSSSNHRQFLKMFPSLSPLVLGLENVEIPMS